MVRRGPQPSDRCPPSCARFRRDYCGHLWEFPDWPLRDSGIGPANFSSGSSFVSRQVSGFFPFPALSCPSGSQYPLSSVSSLSPQLSERTLYEIKRSPAALGIVSATQAPSVDCSANRLLDRGILLAVEMAASLLKVTFNNDYFDRRVSDTPTFDGVGTGQLRQDEVGDQCQPS